MDYPEIVLVSPFNAEKVPIHPEGSDGVSFVNLYGATMESNGLYLLQHNTWLYVPPYWWFQIKWDKRYKIIQYSFPAPSQLKYVFDS